MYVSSWRINCYFPPLVYGWMWIFLSWFPRKQCCQWTTCCQLLGSNTIKNYTLGVESWLGRNSQHGYNPLPQRSTCLASLSPRCAMHFVSVHCMLPSITTSYCTIYTYGCTTCVCIWMYVCCCNVHSFLQIITLTHYVQGGHSFKWTLGCTLIEGKMGAGL